MSVTDDRQTTDHATDKRVAIGEIDCSRAISPNNKKITRNLGHSQTCGGPAM